ncbi:MAG: chloride channel protein [Planctomycetota bacterium]
MQGRRALQLDSFWIYAQAAVIGLVGGGLGVGFRVGIDWIEHFLMGEGAPLLVRLPWWQSVLFPAVGGLFAGLCLWPIGNRRSPFGIGDTVEIVATRKGTIRPHESLVHTVSSGFSIASGGSIGREGANAQLGATVAALLGRLVPNSQRSRTVLLGCGIAAGMAGAYKAPIASALFVMEVVLGNFAMDVLAPIVVASVIATLITLSVFGYEPLYSLGVGGSLKLEDWRLVLSAAVLGAMCGFGGVAFRRSLEFGKKLFARIRAPLAIRMALGGLVVGVIGIQYPEVWGNGQPTIEIFARVGEIPTFTVLVVLLLLKIVATSATAGSGALGGVFTPNLVVGAALGAAFAKIVDSIGGGDHHTHFALVGMAGLCSATAHAPITAILLIFEMTKDYGLILPLMLCSIVASIAARMLDPDSIYTARLRARGHGVDQGLEELAMHTTFVRDAMRRDPVRVTEGATLEKVLDLFNSSRNDTIYVVSEHDHLLGHVLLHDVKQYINDPATRMVMIAADLVSPCVVATAEESLATILEHFHDPDLDEMPVVRSRTEPVLEGRITRRDVVATFSEEVLGQKSMRARLRVRGRKESRWLELPSGAVLERVRVPDDLVDRSLGSLDLWDDHRIQVLVLLEKDATGRERRNFPTADSVLHDNCELLVLGMREDVDAFIARHGGRGAVEE